MDVKEKSRENYDRDEDQNIYVLRDEDVENILVATDALYWTILQIFRGRDRPLNALSPRSLKDTRPPARLLGDCTD